MMKPTAESALDNFLEQLTSGFTPELARHFSELPTPDPDFQTRLDHLADGANNHSLTDDELEEYQRYVEYMDLIALLRLKARLRVANQ